MSMGTRDTARVPADTSACVGADALDALLVGDGPTLMIPGPCEVEAHVLAVLGAQVGAHYGPVWAACHAEVLRLLAGLLDAASVYVLPGSGSGPSTQQWGHCSHRARRWSFQTPDTSGGGSPRSRGHTASSCAPSRCGQDTR